MKKRIMSFVLALMMVLALVPVDAKAADAVTVAVTASTEKVALSEEVTYTVSLKDVPEVGAKGVVVNLVIPEGLEYVSHKILVGNGAYNKDNGRIGIYGLSQSPITKDTDIATVTFKATKVAEYSVAIKDDVQVESAAGGNLVVNTVASGTTTVECKHNYKETARTESTCTVKGSVTYTCEVCGDTYTEELELAEHDYEETARTESTCIVKGSVTYTCGVCKGTYTEELELAEHKFGDWVVTKEATETENGEKVRECSVCGHKEKEVIKSTGKVEDKEEHKHVDANNDGKCDTCGKEIEASKTGDNANVALYAIMMAAAAAVVVYKKRRVEA